jgi:hypothetical protein
MINAQIHNQIKQDFKRVFTINYKLPSTHYFKLSRSGKIHIVHRISGLAFCARTVTFDYKGFTNLIEVNENDICKKCLQFHNGFKVFKND